MESEATSTPTPDEAAAALADAEQSGQRLAERLVLPRWFHASIGAAVAVQIGTSAAAAAGLSSREPASAGPAIGAAWSWALLLAGLAVFGAVAATQLVRLRRLNGVWVGGLASRVVLGTASTASTAYVLALAAATWSAFAEAWWLVPACAVAGGVGYAVSGVRWMRVYRGDPVRHSRAESAWLLAALAVLAVGGLVLLVAGH